MSASIMSTSSRFLRDLPPPLHVQRLRHDDGLGGAGEEAGGHKIFRRRRSCHWNSAAAIANALRWQHSSSTYKSSRASCWLPRGGSEHAAAAGLPDGRHDSSFYVRSPVFAMFISVYSSISSDPVLIIMGEFVGSGAKCLKRGVKEVIRSNSRGNKDLVRFHLIFLFSSVHIFDKERTFLSEDNGYEFFNAFARNKGFSLRKGKVTRATNKDDISSRRWTLNAKSGSCLETGDHVNSMKGTRFSELLMLAKSIFEEASCSIDEYLRWKEILEHEHKEKRKREDIDGESRTTEDQDNNLEADASPINVQDPEIVQSKGAPKRFKNFLDRPNKRRCSECKATDHDKRTCPKIKR
ncbi:hypothetical protein C2845_PM01G46690 [Panicum miliaceum]|uniref:Protein FAR1-RELATED SEQUENCE n=1 Tax=Panicum miliaceum TaxID=4540 RepID=A0A3L6TRP4_PANMI|nr:hypothetical protein C2845_PM01G46690 [Panicum miliaceum]